MEADPSESIRLILVLTPNSSPPLSTSLPLSPNRPPPSLFVLRHRGTRGREANKGRSRREARRSSPRDTLRMFCETILELRWHAAAVSESNGESEPARGKKNHSGQMEPQIVFEGLLPQQSHMGQKCCLAESHLCLSRRGGAALEDLVNKR